MTTLHYDVIVVGAGHAGCEAAHASARLGAKTCLVTMDMNKIGQMSCNPAVGGIAKGQIVREIDALGGAMGIVTDACALQMRMLNMSKGPAMWSPRAQCDREKFIWSWRSVLDRTENLDIWQDQVVELLYESEKLKVKSEKSDDASSSETFSTEDSNSDFSLFTLHSSLKKVRGVRTIWGVEIQAPAVIITAGTFLNGLMHIGRQMVPGGRCAEPAALQLTESINALGITSQRMKTGTPVRIDKRSVHFEDTEIQNGDNPLKDSDGSGFFSYLQRSAVFNKYGIHPAGNLSPLPCWTFNTNKECHETLLKGLPDSPLYNGQIQSIGPRYCPSVETKLVTFPDRTSHPLFLEPEGSDTNEMYLNGFSSSMPIDIQLEALRKIPALRDVKVYRPGYAIEYDFFDPTQLDHTLMNKKAKGLFFAGQVNGTTGYEEAAGQGIVAGINAALYAGNLGSGSTAFKSFTLHRDEAYIGVLIDDLVTKGVDEPYRMFTSRAEYRILLRQDDADARLTPRSYEIGLADGDRMMWYREKEKHVADIIEYCQNSNVRPRDVNAALESIGSTPLSCGCKLRELVARPGISIEFIAESLPQLRALLQQPNNRQHEIASEAETLLKYDGYIVREKQAAEKMHRLENIRIKGHFDYNSIQSLSTEARQKLIRINPETLAQASRIPGVSPSDINVLLILMNR